jgi:hypothetical protein
MRTLLLPLLAGVSAAVLASGCGGSEPIAPIPAQSTVVDTEAPPTTAVDSAATETVGAVELPDAVAATRDAIVAAAHARDYAALEALLDPKTFSYSFGESGDPVGYWKMLEEEGEVPILGDFLPLVLTWPVAKVGDTYVWPSAHARAPTEWTEDDLEPLRQLYTADEIDGFVQAGGYLGYRVGIREDGTWLFFVAGD